MIEFILVAPLLLFILGYSLRLTQLLQAHQIAMMFSREAASEAFRRCTDITILMPSTSSCTEASATCCPEGEICVNLTRTEAATNACISRVKQTALARWNSARPPVKSSAEQIEVEVYRFGLSRFASSLDCTGELREPDKARFSTNATLPDAFSDSGSLPSLCRRNRVARARISFNVEPTGAFLSLIPGLTNAAFAIVDDTVL